MKILLFIFLLVSGNALAQTYTLPTHTLTTGYAYSTCNGNIVGKYSQGAGDIVPLTSGCAITDVSNQMDLNAIQIYQPPQPFSINTFIQEIVQTSLLMDINISQYYAVFKDLLSANNFQSAANYLANLLQNNNVTQGEVNIIDNALEGQQINLDSYNSEVNIAY
jgi:hypothetical protein